MEVEKMKMNPLKKLNLFHGIIMQWIAIDVVYRVGILKEGWTKGDHIQHTSDSLKGQIDLFKKQLDVLAQSVEKEDKESLKSSLAMYKRDRSKIKHNIQFDKLHKELFESLQDYINSLNETINLIEAALSSMQ